MEGRGYGASHRCRQSPRVDRRRAGGWWRCCRGISVWRLKLFRHESRFPDNIAIIPTKRSAFSVVPDRISVSRQKPLKLMLWPAPDALVLAELVGRLTGGLIVFQQGGQQLRNAVAEFGDGWEFRQQRATSSMPSCCKSVPD